MANRAAVICAVAAIQVFDPNTAEVMVAIAGAESNWNPNAGGDAPRLFFDRGMTDYARNVLQWNCPTGAMDGPVSWGLWQINVYPNHPAIRTLMGKTNASPCEMATWLRIPINNARAAQAILQSQGFGAWTVFKTGAWRNYERDAKEAVAEAIARSGRGEGLEAPPIVRVAQAAMIGLGTYLAYSEVTGG